MITRTSKLKCVLFDANIIIEAYKLGIWEKLIDAVKIITPSIIVKEEALFFIKKKKREAINLPSLINRGKIKELSASAEDLKALLDIFDRVFIEGLHEGESEALSLIKENKIEDALFCSSDALAIQALAMIDCSHSGISMEKLLRNTGLTKTLDRQFTEKFFRDHIKRGSQNRITGQGLKKRSW